jgi:deoxyadenosine/deoxycytidine kinase
MKIGLVGTMSVGKTTLAKALGETDRLKDHSVQTERSKYLRDLGIPLNTDSTLKGQFIFLAERASELLQPNIITDRTIWDVCSFTMNAESISEHEKLSFVQSALLLKNEYDLVVYVDPTGVDMEDNGVRTTDIAYRNKIDKTIRDLLTTYPPHLLVKVKGTTEERVDAVLEAISKYL